MITYSYISFDERIGDKQFSELLLSVPESIRTKTLNYRRWQDQHASLLGKLLLKQLLMLYGYDKHCLERLYTNEYGKPFIDNKTDFTISHSGNFVICAVSSLYKIGIDVEKKAAIDLDSFELFLRKDEFNFFKKAMTPDGFYRFWTQKESLLKAKGVGLSIDLKKIYIQDSNGVLNENQQEERWFYYPIDTHRDYVTTLCCNSAGLDLKYISFATLMENVYSCANQPTIPVK